MLVIPHCGLLAFAASEEVPTESSVAEIDGVVVPMINTDSTTTHDDYGYVWSVADRNILNQTVTISILALSDNITSIEIRTREHTTTGKYVDSGTLYEGNSYTFSVPALRGWDLWIKVISGNVSSSNPGYVTIHVKD